MDLTQLANLGEFVGGIAVLVTLIYLALQVRQTKDVVKMESSRATAEEYRAFLFQVSDPDRMENFRKGISNFDDMPANEQALFHAYLTAVMISAVHTFEMQNKGVATVAMSTVVDSFNWAVLRSPGGASWWSQFKGFLPADFVAHTDACVARQAGQPTVPEALSWYRWEEAAP